MSESLSRSANAIIRVPAYLQSYCPAGRTDDVKLCAL